LHSRKRCSGKEAYKDLTIVECAADGVNSKKALCESERTFQGFPRLGDQRPPPSDFQASFCLQGLPWRWRGWGVTLSVGLI